MKRQELMDAWNAQADEYNQWESLGADEMVDFALERMEQENAEEYSELKDAFEALLNAVIDYLEYEHDGDPWTEDARAMGEMAIDQLKNSGKLGEYRALLKRIDDADRENLSSQET